MEIHPELIQNLLSLSDADFQKTLLAVAKAAGINPVIAKAKAGECRTMLREGDIAEFNALLQTLPPEKAAEILKAAKGGQCDR